ncbi:hypothetical protein J6590_059122 [Homalodisca vitripennis]|nr:hypothetical protein J6590_059122 [Homalodisca vitripennis]
MATAGCLLGQDRSAVIYPSSSHARRYLIRLSCDKRRTHYIAPMAKERDSTEKPNARARFKDSSSSNAINRAVNWTVGERCPLRMANSNSPRLLHRKRHNIKAAQLLETVLRSRSSRVPPGP